MEVEKHEFIHIRMHVDEVKDFLFDLECLLQNNNSKELHKKLKRNIDKRIDKIKKVIDKPNN
jgi:uncharacterized protein YggL (DUF469 family)